MGKTFVEDERPCDQCVNRTRYGCASWDCKFIDRDEAIKAWKEKHEMADRKTEQMADDLIRKSDVLETYADLYDTFDDNKAIQEELHKVYDKINDIPAVEQSNSEKPNNCDTCGTPRHLCEYCIAEDRMWTPKTEPFDKDINVRSKTEPQTCDTCRHWQIRKDIYDLDDAYCELFYDNAPCKYEPKDEPQTTERSEQ